MSETKEEKKRGLRLHTKLLLVPVLCLVALGAFLGGAAWGGQPSEPVITSSMLGEQLRSVQELASVEYHYTNMGKFEEQIDFYGWSVPFTTKSFIVSYDGIIKAGVDLSGVEVEVDDIARTVKVVLPSSKILSHEILEDSLEVFDESKNIFNPISIEDYNGFTADQKSEMEEKAVERGLLHSADDKAREAVEALLDLLPELEGYAVTVGITLTCG